MKKHRVIAIDGPAGSGKSTTAKLLASRLGFKYLDTGAMYRSVALVALEKGIDLSNEEAVGDLAAGLDIDFSGDLDDFRVFLDGRDVTLAIRSSRVDATVSQVSAYKSVRL